MLGSIDCQDRDLSPLLTLVERQHVKSTCGLASFVRVFVKLQPQMLSPRGLLSDNGRKEDACRVVFRELRWWSIDEIAGLRETFIPRTLAVLLSALLGGPWPVEPIVIVP
jgi:hypothetical protein